MPKGQEFEIMGLISFYGQILGWAPAFVFTALNENGVSMRWGLASVSFFLMTSCFFTFFCGDFNEAVANVAHTSDEYLNEYSRKSGADLCGVDLPGTYVDENGNYSTRKMEEGDVEEEDKEHATDTPTDEIVAA